MFEVISRWSSVEGAHVGYRMMNKDALLSISSNAFVTPAKTDTNNQSNKILESHVCIAPNILAYSAMLPKRLYILPMFFFIFIFLIINILNPLAENLMDRSSPKFQDW